MKPKLFTKRKSVFFITILLMSTFFSAFTNQIGDAQAANPDGPWVITATAVGALYTVDTSTDTVYGPFLEGQLGENVFLLDVAVSPDGRVALVSSFDDYTVYFVNVTDRTNLALLGSVELSFCAEDIAITSNGKFALVTDGEDSTGVASINIHTMSVVEEVSIASGCAQAVAVSPDGTVICADYYQSMLHTFTIDNGGHLTAAFSYDIPVLDVDGTDFIEYPLNVEVAPDGKTVLVLSTCERESSDYWYGGDYISVYLITSPGSLAYQGKVSGLPPAWDESESCWYGYQQSVIFSDSGNKAYILSNSMFDPIGYDELNDKISVLDINGPGSVSLSISGAATLQDHTVGGFFGVDVLAVSNGKLYAGCPTTLSGINFLQVVNLADFSVNTIPIDESEEEIVTGVAAIPPVLVGGTLDVIAAAQLSTPLFAFAAVFVISAFLLCVGAKKR